MSTRIRKKAVQYTYHLNHPTLKLGKRAPQRDPRTLKLAKYLPKKLPAVPVQNGYITKIASFPMFLNDQLGCCVIAAAGHMIQQWTTYAGKPVILTDTQILQAYEYIGGYKPGHPETDNGCDMLTALKFWRKYGIGNHRILAFVSVDVANQNEIDTGVSLFGNLMSGIQLPLTAQNPVPAVDGTPTWSFPSGGAVGNGSPGSWGGHCVPLFGYNDNPAAGAPRGTKLPTWGQLYNMTPKFFRTFGDELYAVVTQDWVDAQGKSPSGFNINTLLSDLAALPSQAKPA